MTASLFMARHLLALAEATDSRRPEGGEGQPAAGSEPCEMPTVGGPCPLPVDHGDGCEPAPPRCLCGHMPFRHVSERYRCRAPGCGCTRHRKREVQA